MTASAPPAVPKISHPAVVLCVLLVVSTLNFLDRQFLAVLAEPVKADLGLSDTQLGLLTGLAFALFYTFFGIPVAMLADRVSRVRIVAAACATWSVFTALCGFANGFASLAMARVGVAVGEAGGSPPSISIISDYFPPERRGMAISVLTLGLPLGVTLGAASGGVIAANYGWRTAFVALGAVGLLVAPLSLLLVREPRRGRLDPISTQTPRPSLGAVAAFLRSPTLVMSSISAGLCSFVAAALVVWSPALMMRDKGMSLTELSAWYGLVQGAAVALGTMAAGLALGRIVRASPRLYSVIPGVAIMLASPFIAALALSPDWRMALLSLFAASSLSAAYLPAALTLLQNSVPPTERATAAALLLFIMNLIGTGGGPLFVGMLSDRLAAGGEPHALRYAMLALSGVALIAGASQLITSRMLARSS
jgi:predicted MFS family arabinose efflux permease